MLAHTQGDRGSTRLFNYGTHFQFSLSNVLEEKEHLQAGPPISHNISIIFFMYFIRIFILFFFIIFFVDDDLKIIHRLIMGQPKFMQC